MSPPPLPTVLRLGESQEVVERLQSHLGINLTCVDASERFLGKLAGVTDPERKRKIIGGEFIEVFQEQASAIGTVEFLLQGTLYPDVIESVSYKGPAATIKSHHNVGGLPAHMKLQLIEPLREPLFGRGVCRPAPSNAPHADYRPPSLQG